MTSDPQDESGIYRDIVQHIEAELSGGVRNLTIDVVDEEVTVEGAVPSSRDQEDLQRLLFDTLELDQIVFDVVVDEDLQSREPSPDPLDEEIPGEARGPGVDERTLDGPSQSPRRQF